MPPVRLEDVPNLAPDDGFRIEKADPSVAAAPARALGQLGDSIASVGAVFHDLATDTARRKNAKEEMTARVEINRRVADHFQRLPQEAEPDDYVSRTTGLFQQLQGEVRSGKLSPVVRDTMEVELIRMQEEARIRAVSQAALATDSGGREALADTYSRALETGNDGLLESGLSTAVKGGILTHEEAGKVGRQYRSASALKQLEGRAQEDPNPLLEELNDPARHPEVQEGKRRLLIETALRSRETHRAADYRTFYEMAYRGDLREDDLALSEYLTDSDRGALQQFMSGREIDRSRADGETYLELASAQRAFDGHAHGASQYARLWNDSFTTAMRGVDPARRTAVEEAYSEISPSLRERRDAGDASAVTPEAEATRRSNLVFTDGLKAGYFGPYTGAPATEQTRTLRNFRSAQDELSAWQRDHPTATRQEMDARRSSLLTGHAQENAGLPALRDFLSPTPSPSRHATDARSALDSRLGKSESTR